MRSDHLPDNGQASQLLDTPVKNATVNPWIPSIANKFANSKKFESVFYSPEATIIKLTPRHYGRIKSPSKGGPVNILARALPISRNGNGNPVPRICVGGNLAVPGREVDSARVTGVLWYGVNIRGKALINRR